MERIKKNERQGVFFILSGREKDGGWKKKSVVEVWKKEEKEEREEQRGCEKKRTNERTH